MAALALCAGCAVAPGGSAAAMPRPRAFLATYFTDNGQHGVFLAASDDGLLFRPLLEPNIPIIRSEIGGDRLTRDPCLFRGADGVWRLTWTTGWWAPEVGISHSKDLAHWSPQRLLPVMADQPGALNAWAPEITYDAALKQYVLFWSSTVPGRFTHTDASGDEGPKPGVRLNHRLYAATSKDLEQFSPSTLLYDPGFNCIDATMLRLREPHSGWLMIFKDETRHPPAKNLRVARGGGPLDMKPPLAAPITGAYWAEGPMAIQIGGLVRVFFDRYTEGRFGAVESADLEHWTDISDRVRFPAGARHGSVVEVDPGELDALRRLLRNRAARP